MKLSGVVSKYKSIYLVLLIYLLNSMYCIIVPSLHHFLAYAEAP